MSTKASSGPRIALAPVVLAIAVVAAYAPSLGAGFLNYDDPWLIEHNPFLAPDSWSTPLRALSDFSRATRLALGAEYLPLRDLLLWLETRLFGISAPALHTVSVLLYVVSTLFMRGALIRTLGPGAFAEIAAFSFALHPIHVESVAWLAGQKDVLALVFVGAALYVHAGTWRRARWVVPLLVLCACLSKSMSVAVITLLIAQDLYLKRRPDRTLYLGSVAAIALSMVAHLYVGKIVGMVTEAAGGSRYTALITMGPVWLRYLGQCLFPWRLSIALDVPDRTSWDLSAALGYLFVLGWLLSALALYRQNRPLGLFTFLWFFGPLLPVSQVLAPLQNRMADRYAWLSVMAPCLLFAWLVASALERTERGALKLALWGLPVALGVALGALTFDRSIVFSDSVLLFSDGTRKTVRDTDAPYQLGKALDDLGREDEAMAAYREVLARAPSGSDSGASRATNNLSRLLAKRGALLEAERVLKSGLARFPEDDKMRQNLVKVLRGMDRFDEAEGLTKSAP